MGALLERLFFRISARAFFRVISYYSLELLVKSVEKTILSAKKWDGFGMDGLGVILGRFGGIFRTISYRFRNIENSGVQNRKMNLKMTSNTFKNQ